MTVRAKFRCNSVTQFTSGAGGSRRYNFSAVYDTSTPENARFTKATPWGDLSMNVDNPDVDFEIGKSYYLDFAEATE